METLASWIHRRGPLSPRDAVGWAVRVARHLEALHQHGVAHGNVSPACLLISAAAPESRGLVADVRRVSEMVQYHSPERLRTGQLTPADDAWGLAGMVFTAITAQRPFGDARNEIEMRIRSGPPQLAAFGVQDETLSRILGAALYIDPSRRIAHVALLRQELERWFNDPGLIARLPALEDEESGEEDGAATAMVPMGAMLFEDASAAGAGPSAPPPIQANRAAYQEQDATVMRELPAHIMALAARAASGSNPPPPPDDDLNDDDTGGATRVATAEQVGNALANANPPGPVPAPKPPVSSPGRPLPPLGPPSAPGRPGPPSAPRVGPPGPPAPPGPPGSGPVGGGSGPKARPLRSTQLGMGLAPPPRGDGQGPGATAARPGPGFAGPPATASAPPPQQPHRDDDIATVMHAMPAGLQESLNAPLGPKGPPGPPAPPQAPPKNVGAPTFPTADVVPDDDDDDDGQRTVMRDASIPGPDPMPPRAGGPTPAAAAWKPAAPPMGGPRSTASPSGPPGAPMKDSGSAPRPFPAPQAPTPNFGGAGVSALLQEALEGMGPGQGAGAPQPMGAPLSPPMGVPGGPPPGFPAGPFAPGGGQPQQGGLAPQFGVGGYEASGGFNAAGLADAIAPNLQSPSFGAPQQAQPSVGGPFQPTMGGPFAPAGPGGYGQQPQQPIQGNDGFNQSPIGAAPADPYGGFPGQQAQPSPGFGGLADPNAQPGFPGPLQQPGSQPQPQQPARSGSGGLIIVCTLVLVLAATVTYVVLRFRAQLGF